MRDKEEVGEEKYRYHEERPSSFETRSGFPIKGSYNPKDIENMDYCSDLNEPGRFPFTRGIHENMYREKLWNRRICAGFASASDTNKRFKYLIERGQTGLVSIPDVPTQFGLDPDHPNASVNIGTCGIPLYSLREMEELLDGISLENIVFELRTEHSHVAMVVLSHLIACAENKGLDISKLRGSVLHGPIRSPVCSFYTISSLLPIDVKFSVDIIEYAVKHMPLWYPLCPAGYDYRENGINAVQELAFTFAETISYVEAASKRGVKFDDFGRKIVFALSGEMSFFEEIAKIRAARRMWARIAKERLGSTDPRSQRLACSIKTAGSSLTAQQPINNIARTTIETLAAVLGGAQSIDVAGYDEALTLPSEEAGSVALNLQHILAYETDVASVADPLGGSYFIEYLTNKLEEGTLRLLQEIDKMGGMIAAVQKGWVRREVEKAFIERNKEIEEKRRIIVGVNDFTVPKEMEVKIPVYRDKRQEISPEEQIAKIKRLKETRNKEKVIESLKKLRSKAEKGENENLMFPLIEAAKADATLSEVLGIIREANGYSYDPFDVMKNPFF